MSETNGSRAGFDPRVPYDLWLDCFEECEPVKRPIFTFRRVNGAEFNEIGKAMFEAVPQDADSYSATAFKAFRIGLVGWRNQIDPATGEGVDFDLEKVGAVINPHEAIELVEKRLERGKLSGADRKNSATQS